MKLLKILLVILISAGLLSTALAIDAKMDIMPLDNTAEPGEDFLVFGYIYANERISDSDVRIKIYDDDTGALIKTVTPSFEALSGSEPAYRGYFYKKVDISSKGDYDIVLKVNDRTEDTEAMEIKNLGEREAKITYFDYAISGNQITFKVEVQNMDSEDHNVRISLQGEKNFNSPKTFTMDVEAGEKEYVRKTFYVSDFGDENFIVACQARTGSGHEESYSLPAYVLVDDEYDNDYEYDYYNGYSYSYSYPSYGYGNLVITDIELDTNVFYPGDIVEGKVYIRNVGSQESQFRFEYIYDNQAFKMGDVGYVLPGETEAHDIVLEIPDKESFKLTAKVTSGTTDIEERTYLVSQKLKYFSPYLSEEDVYVNAGENATVTLTLKNRGNEDDSYKLSLEGWNFYKMQDTAVIKAGSEQEIKLSFEVPESSKVGLYPVVLDIENSNNVHRTKTIQLSVVKPEAEQSEVVFEDKVENQYFEENETIEYIFTVTNLELDDKTYFAEAVADNADVEVSPESVILESGNTETISVKVTPETTNNTDVELSLYANGEKIFDKELTIEYTDNKDWKVSGITGFAVFEGKPWMPGIYLLALIGMISLGYMGYRVINEKRATEKVVQYNIQSAQKQTLMPQKPAQPSAPADEVRNNSALGNQPQQAPKYYNYNLWETKTPQVPRNDYPEDSFMRRF